VSRNEAVIDAPIERAIDVLCDARPCADRVVREATVRRT
jgi:hypothetical protein